MGVRPLIACRECGQGSTSATCERCSADRTRAKSAAYGKDWQRLRSSHLRHEPLCRACGAEGRVVLATQVDHVIPVRARPDLRLVRSNLQSLCDSCHSRKTRMQD